MLRTIEADLRANVDNTKRTGFGFWLWVLGKTMFAPQVHAVVLHRLAHALWRTPLRPLALPVRSIAMAWSGAEIHPAARLGPGFVLVHSSGVVIGPGSRVGRNCRMHQGATLGDPGLDWRGEKAGFPIVGDDVILGAHAVVLGPCRIGDGAVVGANSVVSRDVAANTAVAGSPAEVVRTLPPVESRDSVRPARAARPGPRDRRS